MAKQLVYVGGNHEHHGPCDFYLDEPYRECEGIIKKCSFCENAPCEAHSLTLDGNVMCQRCISDAVLKIACATCGLGCINGRCLCPAPVTALLDWVDGPVSMAHESLACDLFGPLGVM